MKQFFFVSILAALVSGCGHNFYIENSIDGLDFTIPCGSDGATKIGLTIGSSRSVAASVRGGTSFTTESSSGAGLFTTAAGVGKVTQFKCNSQLNEGNIVKVLCSPEVPESVKVELSKQLVKNTEAPSFPPSATSSRESRTFVAGFTNDIEKVAKYDSTGVDKVVETTPEVVKPIAEATTSVVHDATESVTKITTEVVDDTTDLAKTTVETAAETTENIRESIGLVAFIVFIAGIIAVALNLRKMKKTDPPDPSSPEDSPPLKSPPKKSKEEEEEEAMDEIETEDEIDGGGEESDDLPPDIKDVKLQQTSPPADKPKKTKKPSMFKKFWKWLIGVLGALFTFWQQLSPEQQQKITDGAVKFIKKKRKKKFIFF